MGHLKLNRKDIQAISDIIKVDHNNYFTVTEYVIWVIIPKAIEIGIEPIWTKSLYEDLFIKALNPETLVKDWVKEIIKYEKAHKK